jgi:hypothetical protein
VTPDELAAALERERSADGVPAGGVERVRSRLDSDDTWAEPPAGLLDSILAGIEQERTVEEAGRVDEPGPAGARVADLAAARRNRQRTVLGWIGGLAVAAAVTVFAVLLTRAPQGTEVTLAATPRAPGASAKAWIHDTDTGLAIRLDVHDLPPAPVGYFYQAWMKGPRGTVTIGTFHDRAGSGQVELWSGVSLADYPTLTVTLEPEDGNPASSGVVVLTSKH